MLDAHGEPRTSGEDSGVPGLYFCGFRVTLDGTLRRIGIEAQEIARLIEEETAALGLEATADLAASAGGVEACGVGLGFDDALDLPVLPFEDEAQ